MSSIKKKNKKVSGDSKKGLKIKKEKEAKVNPPTIPRGIGPRGKDLKPPFIPASRPRGIREGGGIKKKEEEEVGRAQNTIKPVAGERESLVEETLKRERYFEAVGRRKTAVARVRLFTRPGDFLVDNKPHIQYFPTLELQKIAEDSLQKMKLLGRFKVTVKVSGGGVHSQAEALRHGLARCLIKFNPDFRKRLKRAGFLRRDPRAKERKKFGLKRARRAPQWHKR